MPQSPFTGQFLRKADISNWILYSGYTKYSSRTKYSAPAYHLRFYCKKNLNFENFYLERLRRRNLQGRSLKKECIFAYNCYINIFQTWLFFFDPSFAGSLLWICEVLNQCIKIKSSGKKVFELRTNLLCPREESLQVFFLKFIFSKLFIAIFTLKMYSFFICKFKWISNKIFLTVYFCWDFNSFSRPRFFE